MNATKSNTLNETEYALYSSTSLCVHAAYLLCCGGGDSSLSGNKVVLLYILTVFQCLHTSVSQYVSIYKTVFLSISVFINKCFSVFQYL